MSELHSILDVGFYPFGNAYWPQEDCPGYREYSHDGRVCWQEKCGVVDPPAECYEGTLRCQHPPYECAVNNYEACVAKLHPDARTYIEYASCTEDNYPDGGQQCAIKAGLNWLDIDACANDPEQTLELMKELGHATAVFKNPGTPTFVVDGAIVEDTDDLTNDLFSAVCNAYDGIATPRVCDDFLTKPSPRDEVRSVIAVQRTL